MNGIIKARVNYIALVLNVFTRLILKNKQRRKNEKNNFCFIGVGQGGILLVTKVSHLMIIFKEAKKQNGKQRV